MDGRGRRTSTGGSRRARRALVLPGAALRVPPLGRHGGPDPPGARPTARWPCATSLPYADLHATDLLWTVDALVQQERLLPGQLPPLLDLMGVGAVVTPADDDPDRSGAPEPADVAARALAEQPGLGAAESPLRARAPGAGGDRMSWGRRSPSRRCAATTCPAARALVRVEPRARQAVVDGSADGARGGWPRSARCRRAAGAALRGRRRTAASSGRWPRPGRRVVIVSDSNRRRALRLLAPRQNTGATLPAGQSPAGGRGVLDPFADGAVPPRRRLPCMRGVLVRGAPFSPPLPQFPEHRPFAALDGDPRTCVAGGHDARFRSLAPQR